jgi:serine/threonine-protein kinase
MTSRSESSGQIIGGRYRVVRELGRGGMGSVFEAENLRTKRRVAIKTMRADTFAEHEDMARRFEREAQAGGQLRHPNIIDVLDMGDDAELGFMFIVQEYLDGGDLGQCLKQVGALSPHAALATLLPVMDALACAHEHGIIHRDIKPDNIFLHETPQGVVPKLIDFGIAKVLRGDDGVSRTTTGQMVGTPNYMSPEQANADREIDARTDVWSMGVVFYKCLTQCLPFSAGSSNALIAKIIYEEPAQLAQTAPYLPADLAAAVQRAIAKDPAARWPSMRAFSAALQSCAAWQGVDAIRAARWVVNVRGQTVEPLPISARVQVPTTAAAGPASSDTSGQRTGPWSGEVAAVRGSPRPPRTSMVMASAAIAGALALAAIIVWPQRQAHVAPSPSRVAASAREGETGPPTGVLPMAMPASVPSSGQRNVSADAGSALAVEQPASAHAVTPAVAPDQPALDAQHVHPGRTHARSTSSHTNPVVRSRTGTHRGINGARILD